MKTTPYHLYAGWLVCGLLTGAIISTAVFVALDYKATPEKFVVYQEMLPKKEHNPTGITQATHRLFANSAIGTCTVVGPMRADNRWWVLTAAHVPHLKVGADVVMVNAENKARTARVVVRNIEHDVCWMLTVKPDPTLYCVTLAEKEPAANFSLFHYNLELVKGVRYGRVADKQLNNKRFQIEMPIPTGSSGSGVFLTETNELVSCVSSTTRLGKLATAFGARLEKIKELKPLQDLNFDQLVHTQE